MKIILSFVFCGYLCGVFAQDSEKFLKYRDDENFGGGYVVFKNGEQRPGLIYKKGGVYGVIFVELSGEKTEYGPSSLLSYVVGGTDFISDGVKFIEVTQTGKRVLLHKKRVTQSVQSTAGGFPMYSEKEVDVIYVKKVIDGLWTSVTKTGFKKRFGKFFADCPDLKDKIENGALTIDDFEEIVYTYNELCP